MAKRSKEKLWLRCVNIGNNPSDAEIEKFLDSISEVDLQVKIIGLDFKPMIDGKNPIGWEIPNIDDFKDFHKEFMNIFHYRLETKQLHDSEEEWLNNYPLKCKTILLSYPDDSIAVNKRYEIGFRLDIQPIQNYIVNQFNLFLKSGKKVRQCAAGDCNLFFIPKLKNQIYHSDRCRKRIWARKNKN